MIKPEMAQRLIDRITEYTEYNINIMNEKGVIIASRDPGRIGTYHEEAARILQSGEDMAAIKDAGIYPGVLPGINMVIRADGKREGVLGVTGDPAHIQDVAMVTRLAMEAMLKYEREQEKVLLRRSRKENFLNLLTRVENVDPAELRAEAQRLAYDETLLRVPILCRILDGTAPEDVLRSIRSNRGHGPQDLSEVLDDTHVLVFRTMRETGKRGIFSIRQKTLAYLDGTLKWMARGNIRAVFYIGTIQDAFSQYYYAFRHCKWLEEKIGVSPWIGALSGTGAAAGIGAPSGTGVSSGTGAAAGIGAPSETGVASAGDRVIFFNDHAAEYFHSVLPAEELQRVFRHYGAQLKGAERESFLEEAEALIETNFNLAETARRLYIHKNTMMYRYNKLKDRFEIDPVRNSADRSFLILLYYSLRRQKQS